MTSTAVMLYEKFSAEAIAGHSSLDLRSIDARSWQTILAPCTASELRLYYLKIKSLSGVERLRHTRNLTIEYANKIEDISPLFRMGWLTKLSLFDLPRIRRLDGIDALNALTELRLSGNRGSLDPPLRLASVRPIVGLRQLEALELTNLRLEDRDVSFIATAFPVLRSLRLSGKEFERSQFAFLAKKLNRQLDEPIPSSLEMEYAPCPKCGGHLHVFMGRRMPVLCKLCDEIRFRKLTEEFERDAS